MARATCGGCSWARARNLAQLRRADRSGVSTAPVGLHDRRVARNLAHMQQDLRQRRARAHFYGGDVQGKKAAAHMQEAVCLHKSTNKAVRAISDTIITGTYTCSLEAAELMVEQGHATPEDFWLLFGYAGWAAGQLQMEIDKRASWHVAAASPVLLHELIAQASASKTAHAGMEVWEVGESQGGGAAVSGRLCASRGSVPSRGSSAEIWVADIQFYPFALATRGVGANGGPGG